MIHSKQYLQNAGITLVALVVTIIAILILAGVTISLALGDNGIIGKAQYSSNMYANVTKNETTMMGEIEDSVVDLTDTSEIEIKDTEGKRIKISKISDYYGHDVTYNGQTYQLFLVDTTGKYSGGQPGVWLQYKGYVSGVNLDTYYEATVISDINSVLWQVNPDLKRYATEIWSNLCTNMKRVTYLTNPENWNGTYVEEGDVKKGVYAIGGVSAEMFCDSYNQARGINDTDTDYFEAKVFNKNSTYGYLFKPCHVDAGTKVREYGSYTDDVNYAIRSTQNRGMYILDNKYPWLASPSAYHSAHVCIADGFNSRLGYNRAVSHGVRPAVYFPSNISIQLAS